MGDEVFLSALRKIRLSTPDGQQLPQCQVSEPLHALKNYPGPQRPFVMCWDLTVFVAV